MKTLEENLDKLSRNKLASVAAMVAQLQSGDISSKLHDMARKSGYQKKEVNKSAVGKLTPKQIELITIAINKRK